MSEVVVGSETSDEPPTREELAERLTKIEREKDAEIQQLREKVEDQGETIERLRQLIQNQPTFQWGTPNPRDFKVVHPDTGSVFRLGDNAVETLPAGFTPSDLGDMEKDIEALKRGEVDPTDVVAAFEPDLPIEEDVAKAMDDVMSSDLSANEKRAVHIFRAFGGRSRKYNGVLKVESGDVRNILEEKGENDPNPNTVKRAMKMLAKKTSGLPKEDRDAYDSENLLTLHKAKNCLELRADSSEWNEYIEEVEERVER